MSLIQQKLAAETARQPRSITDVLIDALTPLMILIMVMSVVQFLLDVRWVYTAVHANNLRAVAFFFVLGIVALNRMVAREGSDESFLYFAVFAGTIAIYTMATTTMYDVGSIVTVEEYGPWVDVAINMAVVVFVWWTTNRLTHEDPAAGEIGILTGTAQKFRQAMSQGDENKEKNVKEPLFRRKKKEEEKLSFLIQNEIEAYDPTTDYADMSEAATETKQTADTPTERAPRRHPGISIFYFSVPVLVVFAVGLRVTQHGGDYMIRMGQFYMGLYCVSALSLLMLSSLGGLREYFRSRRIHIPAMIGPFWIGLGSLMIVMVLAGALAVPLPDMPPLAYVPERELDPWNRDDMWQPLQVLPDAAERLEQSRFIEYTRYVAIGAFALLMLYGLIRAIGDLAVRIAKQRHRFPPWIIRLFAFIDRVLMRLTTLPTLPSLPRRRRISRDVALSADLRSPLGDDTIRQDSQAVLEKSYEALCALAMDLGVPRADSSTPYEFLDSFPRELKGLKKPARDLTEMYVQSAYANRKFTERDLDRIRKFWIQYDRVRRSVLK